MLLCLSRFRPPSIGRRSRDFPSQGVNTFQDEAISTSMQAGYRGLTPWEIKLWKSGWDTNASVFLDAGHSRLMTTVHWNFRRIAYVHFGLGPVATHSL